MVENRHTLRCAAYAFFIKNNRILLILRRNTGWMDGYYGLPAGHLEENETIRDALAREVVEEVGININPDDLEFIHLMHRNERDNFEYIDLFFIAKSWRGTPMNNEPNKATRIKWFDLSSLPDNVVPNVKAAIEHYKDKALFSEFK